jgi:hypothetical protein
MGAMNGEATSVAIIDEPTGINSIRGVDTNE